jgi:hypothetical protein
MGDMSHVQVEVVIQVDEDESVEVLSVTGWEPKFDSEVLNDLRGSLLQRSNWESQVVAAIGYMSYLHDLTNWRIVVLQFGVEIKRIEHLVPEAYDAQPRRVSRYEREPVI